VRSGSCVVEFNKEGQASPPQNPTETLDHRGKAAIRFGVRFESCRRR
jgi:hypothetical protein